MLIILMLEKEKEGGEGGGVKVDVWSIYWTLKTVQIKLLSKVLQPIDFFVVVLNLFILLPMSKITMELLDDCLKTDLRIYFI